MVVEPGALVEVLEEVFQTVRHEAPEDFAHTMKSRAETAKPGTHMRLDLGLVVLPASDQRAALRGNLLLWYRVLGNGMVIVNIGREDDTRDSWLLIRHLEQRVPAQHRGH